MADFITAGGHRLEVARFAPPVPPGAGAPTIVLLHEGLGCVAMWKDWPDVLARETGLPVTAYSRWGYGASDPVTPPRPLRYMQDEGEVTLGEVLDACAIERAILVGHSDGGSIALVHAAVDAARASRRIAGVVTLAAHVFCEDVSVASIAKARDAFEHGDLRAKLARYHGANVDGAFWGWNRAWLDPAFRAWSIESYLPRITCPTLVIQGDADPYGTLAQVDAIVRGVRGPSQRLVLPACGHAPHKEEAAETTAAIVRLTASLAVAPQTVFEW